MSSDVPETSSQQLTHYALLISLRLKTASLAPAFKGSVEDLH